jgi:hypothetical protein
MHLNRRSPPAGDDEVVAEKPEELGAQFRSYFFQGPLSVGFAGKPSLRHLGKSRFKLPEVKNYVTT